MSNNPTLLEESKPKGWKAGINSDPKTFFASLDK